MADLIPTNDPSVKILVELRKEFLDLYTKHKYMVENDLLILNSIYLEKIGHLQLKLLNKQAEAARCKFKMMLLQAAVNRSERPDLEQIEQQVELKMQSHYARINDQAMAMEAAKHVLSNLMSEEDSGKLKELFRLLCKRLHPDLNPDLTEEEQDLFVKVKAAYELKDITELQGILLYLDGTGGDNPLNLTPQERAERIKNLEKSINGLIVKIEELRMSFPFNIEKQIMDDNYIAGRQEEINAQCFAADNDIAQYKEIISLILDE
jgi:hypothetical protein